MINSPSTSTGRRVSIPQPSSQAILAILVGMNAIYYFAYFQRVAVPGTIFDELQSTFDVTASAVATVGAIYLYIYGGMQIFAGMMNDRLGALRVLLIGGLLLSIGSVLFPLSPSIWVLYAARAIVGLGASLIYISVVKALDMLFSPARFPQILSISMAIGFAGGLTGTFPFERAVHAWGWRGALLVAGILCTLAFLGAAILFRKTGQAHQRQPVSPLVIGDILKNRLSLPILICTPVTFAVYFLVQATLGKKFLMDCGGMSSALASLFPFLMMLTSLCAVLAGGYLPRLIGNRRKPIMIGGMAFLVTGVGLLLLFLRCNVSGNWYLLCYMLMAVSSIASPVSNALMKELNPPDAVGTAIGSFNGASYLAVALLTSLSGVVMDRFRSGAVKTVEATIYPPEAYLAIFTICFLLALAALAVSFFLKESHGKAIYAEAEKTPV